MSFIQRARPQPLPLALAGILRHHRERQLLQPALPSPPIRPLDDTLVEQTPTTCSACAGSAPTLGIQHVVAVHLNEANASSSDTIESSKSSANSSSQMGWVMACLSSRDRTAGQGRHASTNARCGYRSCSVVGSMLDDMTSQLMAASKTRPLLVSSAVSSLP